MQAQSVGRFSTRQVLSYGVFAADKNQAAIRIMLQKCQSRGDHHSGPVVTAHGIKCNSDRLTHAGNRSLSDWTGPSETTSVDYLSTTLRPR